MGRFVVKQGLGHAGGDVVMCGASQKLFHVYYYNITLNKSNGSR